MRGLYVILGFVLIAVPSFLCGFAFDVVKNLHARGVDPEKIPDTILFGFMISSPVSVPLAILGVILISRGITGRPFRRCNKKALSYFYENKI